MSVSRRKWARGERVEVCGFTPYGTVVGEHLDGPLVILDCDPEKTVRRVHWRDAWLLPPARLIETVPSPYGPQTRIIVP